MTTKLVWKNPNAIVSCEWLHNNLNNPDIRIYDCTTYLHYKDNDPSLPYIVESGRKKYDTKHIKNSSFMDLHLDLSDEKSPYRFTLPKLEKLAEKFKKEEIDVEVVIATNAAMKVVGKLGQILGPKGLMPNPKTGTVSDDVTSAIKNVKAGQVRFRTDKNGIIHGSIGMVNFESKKIKENALVLVDELKKLKPASAKGVFIGNISISSTMGPGIKISSSELT